MSTIRSNSNSSSSSAQAPANMHLVWWEQASMLQEWQGPMAAFLMSAQPRPPSPRRHPKLPGTHLAELWTGRKNTGPHRWWFHLRSHQTMLQTIPSSNNSPCNSSRSVSSNTALCPTPILKCRWFTRCSTCMANTPCPGFPRQAWGPPRARALEWRDRLIPWTTGKAKLVSQITSTQVALIFRCKVKKLILWRAFLLLPSMAIFFSQKPLCQHFIWRLKSQQVVWKVF